MRTYPNISGCEDIAAPPARFSVGSAPRLSSLILAGAVVTFASRASGQQVVLQNGTNNFTEGYAFQFSPADDTNEMIATNGDGTTLNPHTQWYGCTRDN